MGRRHEIKFVRGTRCPWLSRFNWKLPQWGIIVVYINDLTIWGSGEKKVFHDVLYEVYFRTFNFFFLLTGYLLVPFPFKVLYLCVDDTIFVRNRAYCQKSPCTYIAWLENAEKIFVSDKKTDFPLSPDQVSFE